MSSFLTVTQLCKSFVSGTEKIEVLKDLDLELPRGRMLAVTGESGSGKSTLLHLLGGMEKADSGRIVVDGIQVNSLRGYPLAAFRNANIGFVFQFHHLLPEFTALENTMFPLLIRGVGKRPAEERGKALLKEVGLDNRLNHRPGELSGGEQQRVAIARSLAGSPTLLLADEPTGNLDAKTARSVYELILEAHAHHHLTSIIVTHNRELASLCHEEKCMCQGKLLGSA